MPSPIFEISNLHNDPTAPRLWWAEVRVNFEETLDEFEVAHWVTMKVRVTAPETVTVQELREALFQKAVQQLRRASEVVEGKSAQELLRDAQTAYEVEQRLRNLSFTSPS